MIKKECKCYVILKCLHFSTIIVTDLLELVRNFQHDERPLSELGETPESLIPNHDRTGPFIFGKDKEATQLAIVLKHMEKEDLLRNPGSVMNSELNQLLQQAKKIMQNPKGHSNSGHGFLSEQMSRNKKLKGSLGQKFHKYFDSPEGQLFNPPKMESILPSKENLFEATNETNSDTMKIANELSESQSNSVYTSSVPNIVATKSTNSENNLVPELKSSTLKVNSIKGTHTQVKKERKLNLPSCILGAKPGVIPNSKYDKQYSQVRMKSTTASTTKSLKKNSNHGVSGFVSIPSTFKFGKIISGTMTERSVELTNVGFESCRFIIRKPKADYITVHYKHGSVAPGMHVLLTIRIQKVLEENELLIFNDSIQVVTEAEILTIPIIGEISP
ncbi:hypothetical protein BC833DRAFT_85524 [Globomyces pollinis-pini]|nr:hypothetical protein BC833DRAFT_85524 [Globomyces pollinis-pini]